MVGKSVGWFSEVENCRGLSRLQPEEFERIVKLFDGKKHRELFRTWVAVQRNRDRTDRSLDGPVLECIRDRKDLTLHRASKVRITKKRDTDLLPKKVDHFLAVFSRGVGLSPAWLQTPLQDADSMLALGGKYLINLSAFL